jgi:hypothetical protein
VSTIKGQKQYSQTQSAEIKCFEHAAKEKKQGDMHAVQSQLAPAAVLKLVDRGGDACCQAHCEGARYHQSFLLATPSTCLPTKVVQRNLTT